ncbi:uncharacterized protein [Chelonus insularis]|uniref:uncharacterized protein n=1 Tax=Chelonus insularis TaxID=460826 RepID=UPI00158B0218|nr:uncharacterized protein LOC118069829 [Chelonus insularis]
MDDKKITNIMRTPLRNSNLANKPFCSPFKCDTTPIKNNAKRLLSSPIHISLSPEHLIKRRRIELEDPENSPQNTDSTEKVEKKFNVNKRDLLELKKRVRNLRQEVESLKVKLAYRRKHKKEDLRADIDKWRQACHKALIQYQVDCSENNQSETSIEISDILLNLGIPEDIVKFPKD